METQASIEIRPISYEDALAHTENQRRHLLLGNGFSIAAWSAFQYRSLREAATLSQDLTDLFTELATTDFEEALRFLTDRLRTQSEGSDRDRLQMQSRELKEHLIRAIAAVHPRSSISMTEDEYSCCSRFLMSFNGKKRAKSGRIFTTSYDLLLYWTIVRYKALLNVDDGFMYGVWNPDRAGNSDVFYLHGALHLFDVNGEVIGVRYRPLDPLIPQIRARLNRDEFPIFVSEGTSGQKLARISTSRYLKAARQKFSLACKQRDDALFTIGHGLGVQEAHITDAIGQGQIGSVFIGAYGGLDGQDGKRIKVLADDWSNQRRVQNTPSSLMIYAFDSSKCAIWSQVST